MFLRGEVENPVYNVAVESRSRTESNLQILFGSVRVDPCSIVHVMDWIDCDLWIGCHWTDAPNFKTPGAIAQSSTIATVEDCQAACQAQWPSCSAVDFDQTAQVNTRCWFSNIQASVSVNSGPITHYSLHCPVLSKYKMLAKYLQLTDHICLMERTALLLTKVIGIRNSTTFLFTCAFILFIYFTWTYIHQSM